jgi:PAS domain-containing protein
VYRADIALLGSRAMSPYALGLELTLVLAFWLALAVCQKDPWTPGRLTFVLTALAAGVWCFGELAVERGMLGELVADRIKYAGALALPALWLGLAAQAARLELAARMSWFPLVLLAPLTIVYALLYVPGWGGLFTTVSEGLPDVHGPLWWVAISYNWILSLLGAGVLLYSAWSRRGPRSGRRSGLALATCVPLAANACYVGAGQSWSHDPTPVLLGVALLALRGAVFSGELLQLLPISQRELLQQLPIGVLLTDRRGTVQSLNPAAERRLGVRADQAVGRNLDAVLESAADPPGFEAVPLRSFESAAGQVVLLDPPGKRS